jgi:hypothetical protein
VGPADRHRRRVGDRRGRPLAERVGLRRRHGHLSQGELFRAEAVLAVAVGLLVLLWPRRGSWVAAFGVGASALAAVLLYRYVDLGPLGPLPNMYENTWQVPGKLRHEAW